ncbi:MAG: cysteine desulfurase [Clostridia bacterium]|nr:cysteine desulfurase [Clostridia bacterium]
MYIYLDNAATTMVCREAAEKAAELMQTCYGNPSSLHRAGLDAEKQVKAARQKIANIWQVRPEQIYFTSGGSEGNNMAIRGALSRNRARGNVVITSKIEHPSVMRTVKAAEQDGFRVLQLDVDGEGKIDLEQLRTMLNDKVSLVSIMHVNNETGVMQDINTIAHLVKQHSRALFHTDMVQSFGKLSVKLSPDIDMATLSGHKIHAPKGIGALYVKDANGITPLIYGGGQEKNMRSGTENTPGICALGIAAELAANADSGYISELKQTLQNGIVQTIDNAVVHGTDTSPYVLNISFPGLRAEVLLHTLESHGIMVSSGSACSSNHPAPSPTLLAMGCSRAEIEGAIRFSFSRFNTQEEIQTCLEVLRREVPLLRKFAAKAR